MCARLFFPLILIFSVFQAFPSVFEGMEPAYANQELIFKSLSDPVTKNETELFRVKIKPDGSFSFEADLKNTTFGFCEFGVYRGLIILEPGKNKLRLKLPPFKEKTSAETRNPYFKPSVLWMKTESGVENETNSLVLKFESRFNQLTDKYFNQLYIRQSKIVLDSVKNILSGEFSKYANPLFNEIKNFKIKILEAEVNRASQEKILNGIEANTFSFLNPAFIDLIDRVFANKLSFEANSVKGGSLQAAVNKKDISFVKKFVSEKYGLTSGMADFMLLKLFYDAFYSGQFSKTAILAMFDAPLFLQNTDPEIPAFAKAIKQKLLFLLPGTKAPEICLANLDGTLCCSGKSQKPTYLMFADLDIQVCREHLKYLETIGEKYKANLDIFIVLKNPGKETAQKFFSEYKIPGIKVIDTPENKFSAVYKVRSYPSCYLLNEKHEVILSPAKPPLDGFEHEFARVLKNQYLQSRGQQ